VTALLLQPSSALANGVDLPVREGISGERVRVSGHDWLTCCPSNTPVEHVELFLIAHGRRIRLFDVTADRKGRISAAFTVPQVRGGTYRLEACSRDPGGTICLPEGLFRVLPSSLAATGAPLAWPLALAVLLIGCWGHGAGSRMGPAQPSNDDSNGSIESDQRKGEPTPQVPETTFGPSVVSDMRGPDARMTVLEVQEALRAAYEEDYVPLLRLCVLLSGDQQVAEDIVQDAFVRFAPKIGEVPVEHLGPYLRRTAVNVWKNRLRSLTRERRARDHSGMNRITDPIGREDRAALRSAVLGLPRRQRACLVLRYYEDLPEREVARLLGCSIGTVKSQTSRSLARLKRELEG